MKKKGGGIFVFLFLVLVLGFFYTQKTIASVSNVVINEVCWMGGAESSNDEWIELKNNTDSDINLEGWILESRDGSPSIVLEGIISALGYFLLERSDDDSVPGVLADLIYSGALGNDGEELELKDEDDNLIDSVEISDGWAGGDNETNQTMERVGANWQTSVDAGGTPRGENSLVQNIEDDIDDEENLLTEEDGPASAKAMADKSKMEIVINEIYPNPRGSDREFEFIELYNKGDAGGDLTGWRLEDEGARVYEFGKFDSLFDFEINNKIGRGGYLAIFRNISGIVLNNNGGVIKLFSPSSKKAKQTLKYDKAEEGLSYVNTHEIRLDYISTSTKKFFLNSSQVGAWVWSKRATPGANNQIDQVNSPPQVEFSFPKKVLPKESISFDASDTIDEEGDDLQFSWDFGDGVKINLAEASHVFLEPGVYNVKLEVNDGKESSFLEKSINVFGDLEESVNSLVENNVIGNKEEYDFSWFDEVDWEDDYDAPVFVKEDNFKEVSLEMAREAPVGTKLKLKGVVVAGSGVFGSQYFYIAGKSVFKVYNYKKDFPDLSLGDLIEVQGEVSESRDEKYLKTKGIVDIEIIDQVDLIRPEKIDDFNKDYLYRLVEVEGEILEKKNSRVYLGVNWRDNWREVVIYVKSLTGIDTKKFNKEDNIKVTGLVLKVSDELVIMPRDDNDIVLLEEDDVGEVAGIEENTEEWEIESRDKKGDFFKYLIVIIIAIVVVSAILIIKKRKREI